MKSKIELPNFYWVYVLAVIEQRKRKAIKEYNKSPENKYKKAKADLYTDIYNENFYDYKVLWWNVSSYCSCFIEICCQKVEE